MYSKRVALFVLKDNKGKLLLQHRSKDDDKIPNYWAFFGGHIEEGESPEQAVKREAKEELGLDLKAELFKRYELKTPWGLHEAFVFTAPLKDSLEKLRKQQTEGQGLDLFSFDDLKNLKLLDTDKSILRELFGK